MVTRVYNQGGLHLANVLKTVFKKYYIVNTLQPTLLTGGWGAGCLRNIRLSDATAPPADSYRNNQHLINSKAMWTKPQDVCQAFFPSKNTWLCQFWTSACPGNVQQFDWNEMFPHLWTHRFFFKVLAVQQTNLSRAEILACCTYWARHRKWIHICIFFIDSLKGNYTLTCPCVNAVVLLHRLNVAFTVINLFVYFSNLYPSFPRSQDLVQGDLQHWIYRNKSKINPLEKKAATRPLQEVQWN